MGFLILDLNALGKKNLSTILPISTRSLSIIISKPVIIGENHVPKVVQAVKYALDIRLFAEMFIIIADTAGSLGLINGPVIEDWQHRSLLDITVDQRIDGALPLGGAGGRCVIG